LLGYEYRELTPKIATTGYHCDDDDDDDDVVSNFENVRRAYKQNISHHFFNDSKGVDFV
jgi:hypothetical protein